MRYGIFDLPSLSRADHANAAERFHSIVEQVAYGEELGFDSVWLAEHHFHSFGGILSSPPVIGGAICAANHKDSHWHRRNFVAVPQSVADRRGLRDA